MGRFLNNPVIFYMLAVVTAWIGIFILTTGLPDASIAISGGKATWENLEYLRQDLELDQPVWRRFVGFWDRLFRGELRSYYTREPLLAVLATKLRISGTLLLTALCGLLVLTIAWISIMSALRYSHLAVSLLIGLTSSVPLFISLPIVLFICGRLGIAPVIGGGFSLAIYPSLLLATNLIDLTGGKKAPPLYIILARQSGLRGPAWLAMQMRASHSAVQILLNSVAFFILMGIPVAELMLGIPGAGRWMLESILRIDLPVVYLCATLCALLCGIVFYIENIYATWAGAKEAT